MVCSSSEGGGHGERAEFGLQLRGDETRAGRGEVERCELEVPVLRPVRQHAQHVAQVGLGLETVQLARRDEAEEGGRRLRRVIAPDEEPRLATGGEVQLILPMSNFARAFTTRGTPRATGNSRCSTGSSGGAKRSSSATCLTAPDRRSLRGCSMPLHAHE